MNRKIILLLTLICVLFLSLAVYLSVFGITDAKELEKSVYNQRLYDMEKGIERGKILDKNGVVLAESKKKDGSFVREYPYGKLYTHVIGYSSKLYGKSKIELSFNDYLTGDNEIGAALNIASAVTGGGKSGFDVTLTIDHKLQSYASDLLSGRNGSIILLDAKSGAVRAMVSNPTFDPSEEYLTSHWEELTEREDSPFLSRATGGLYAPGSTWKIITAAAALSGGFENEIFDDQGKIILGGREYINSKEKAFGEIDLYKAFALSSNVVFAKLGSTMGKEGLSIYEDFLLGKQIGFDIPLEESFLSDRISKMSEADIASTSIGQGKLMVTPLYMTLVASAIANNGEIIKPYLAESIDKGEFNVYKAKRKVLKRAISEEDAEKIKEMMRLCVTEGTGQAANLKAIEVYGKTGTAQNEREKSHDWFIGFGENEEGEKSVVCVLLEYGGVGSSEATYMAGKMLNYSLN